MTVKEHYDRYLGSFYSWMVGDFTEKQQEQERFFLVNDITPHFSKIAFDLGCGHGLQAISLANLGFDVRAIDFNQRLLDELRERVGPLSVTCTEAHLLEYLYAVRLKP